MRDTVKPRALRPGDCVGITAPASCGELEQAKKAAVHLERLGLTVRFGATLSKQYGYLAGTDEERAAELNAMFADPGIQGIVCARGGYGTARMAELLDYDTIAANPKVFWGYSDITFLHAAIGGRTGLVTFHGPMLVCLAKEDVHPLTVRSLEMMMGQDVRLPETLQLQTLVEGEAAGPIIGGNLTLLASSIGTPFEVDTAGKLLLIEEIEEEPYRIDRMLNQLRMAGKLDAAAGILIGDFTDCEPQKRKPSFDWQEVVRQYVVPAGRPAVMGLPIGHGSPHIAVPLGVPARLKTAENTLELLESALAD
ncbi:putative murein peptide carboxypeptidase [Paenibacillus sp. J31TS4]|uniref:S66 peptidase family protein n=1 Tax=Paenibacillus sp. J31TS4 TaxID=2807195 RepID=UPI001B291062|nr:LD-carboxypeptidase [Paenibacillus sp. J31TS4]GIP37740.1 putative murein peptide carboxypeptidase [Paenibacillus sp. J31TS4]